MKTRTVQFSYGTVKDASLKIPAEPANIVQVVSLIRESYLEYLFRPGCGIFSDEVAVSSIGQANFFAGALGGWETRVDADTFARLKGYAEDKMGLAIAVVKFRRCNAEISHAEACRIASRNEALSQGERDALAMMATL